MSLLDSTAPLRLGLIGQGSADWIGGRYYIGHLVHALNALPAQERSMLRICLFSSTHGAREEWSGLIDQVDEYHEPPQPSTTWRRRATRLARLATRTDVAEAILLRRARIDFAYPFCRGVAPLPFGSAAWIPDFQHLRMKHMFSRNARIRRTLNFSAAAAFSKTVVLSSHDAERDFRRVFPMFANKARVLHFHTMAPAAWFEPRYAEVLREYHLPERFFLVSNQMWKHKNHEVLFNALGVLSKRGVKVNLVCTGRMLDYRHPDHPESMRALLKRHGTDAQVHLLGLIPRLDQIQLMRGCLAVVQPSLFEGWGTVVEDARSIGQRLILSDIPVHREQAPKNAIFFRPTDPEDLADKLARAADWSAGPDREREDQAQGRQRQLIASFGSRFLELALEGRRKG